MQLIDKVMDHYCLDGILGFIPFGIGDWIAAAISMVYIYFSMFVVRSASLSIAMTVNIVRDILLGLLPFGVGNVIDFFHRSNRQNMRLIEGFVNNDQEVVKLVNAKKKQGIVALLAMLLLLLLLFVFLVWLSGKVLGWLF